mgnify:CR=1 FL=1
MERKYGIGLDIGIGSVGYAVISRTNNLDARIEDIGVRLFDSGENNPPKKQAMRKKGVDTEVHADLHSQKKTP